MKIIIDKGVITDVRQAKASPDGKYPARVYFVVRLPSSEVGSSGSLPLSSALFGADELRKYELHPVRIEAACRPILWNNNLRLEVTSWSCKPFASNSAS